MNINVQEKDGTVTVTLEGRLDTVTAPELTGIVSEAKFTELTVNLDKLEYISSAGLRALLVCKKTADGQGAKMTVEKPCAAVFEVMKVSGFTKILHISEG